jgi:hypothetical protein
VLARFATLFLAVFFLGCMALDAQDCDSVRILSPANDADYSSVPLRVSVRTTEDSCSSGFHASLDRVDITRLFGPSVHGVRQAFLYHRNLRAGGNRLVVGNGQQRDVVRFVFRPSSSAVPASSQSLPTFVPIKTRIVSGDGTKFSDYAARVGSQVYSAPDLNPADTDGYGFQVLVLDRATLKLVSNNSYPTDFLGEVLSLDGKLKSQYLSSGCGAHGCLVIVQTFLGSGLGNNGLDLDGLGYIGGTTEMNNVNGNNGYSLITTVGNPNQGAPEESGYERIACSPRQAVCGAPIHGSGQITGTLVLDNKNAYTFAQPSRFTFSTGTAPNSTSNTITVGSTEYPSSTLNAGGGFQLVVLDRTTLDQVLNETYTMDQLDNLTSAITSHNNINYLFLLSSIGTVARPSSPSGLVSWYALASALTQIGGTYTVFDHLAAGDDYSLVGAYSSPNIGNGPFSTGPSGFARFNVQEASSIISRAIQPVGATTRDSDIHGVLRLDHEGYYAAILSNVSSNFFSTSTENLLDAVALQTPIAWPYPQSGHPGQQAAYTYFSQQACSCGDVRSNYSDLDAPLASYQGNITRAVYKKSLGFSEDDFETLQNQLNTELTYTIAIQKFENNLTTLFTAENSNLGLLLTNDYTTVEQNLYQPPPPPSDSTFFDVLDVTADGLSLASYVEQLTPEGQLAAGAASIALYVTEDFIHSPSGPPALNQKGQLLSTYGALASDAASNFADGEYQIGNLFDLILSDWGKLQALGLPLDQGKIVWDDSLTGEILGNYDRSIRKQYLISLMAGVFGVEHDAQVVGASTPPSGWIFEGNPPPFGPRPDLSLPAEILLPSGPNGQTPSSGNNGQYYDAYVLWNHQSPFIGAQPVSSQVLTPLFAPLNLDDPSQLGQYQPWFFTKGSEIPATCINQTKQGSCASQ